MSLQIEQVTQDDLIDLVKISRKTFFDTFQNHNTVEDMQLFLDSTFVPEALQIEMNVLTNFFFLARQQHSVVGYLKLSTAPIEGLNEKEVLEISRIYVDKTKIGSGVGKAIMEFSIDYAKKLNKKIVFLGVWEHNQRGIDFYTKFGFEKFGEHKFLLGNDLQTDWLMKKII